MIDQCEAGILVGGGDVVEVLDNRVTNNSPRGGIECRYSTIHIKGNFIDGNKGGRSAFGTGIGLINCTAWITGIRITHNTGGYTNGIHCNESSVKISDNIMAFNDNGFSGGGITCYETDGLIANNTIIHNYCEMIGGGIFCQEGSKIEIRNTIIYYNLAWAASQLGVDSTSTVVVSHCNIQDGWSGTGNIDAPPEFIDEPNADYHLAYDSPGRDAGDAGPEFELLDMEGDPRVAYGLPDMGADEFYRHLYWAGEAVPGQEVKIRIVDLPRAGPVLLFVGSGILDTPLCTKWGDWYLEFPVPAELNLGRIPTPRGWMEASLRLPANMQVPSSISLQALVGQALTNPSVIEIE